MESILVYKNQIGIVICEICVLGFGLLSGTMFSVGHIVNEEGLQCE